MAGTVSGSGGGGAVKLYSLTHSLTTSQDRIWGSMRVCVTCKVGSSLKFHKIAVALESSQSTRSSFPVRDWWHHLTCHVVSPRGALPGWLGRWAGTEAACVTDEWCYLQQLRFCTDSRCPLLAWTNVTSLTLDDRPTFPLAGFFRCWQHGSLAFFSQRNSV